MNKEPLWKLARHIEELTGVRVVMDRASWEAGVVVTLEERNPEIGKLLDHLKENHGIRYIYDMDWDGMQGKLYLLKSR